MNKARSKPPKKELSEGTAIIITVFLVTAGLIGFYFLIKLALDFFFPGLL